MDAAVLTIVINKLSDLLEKKVALIAGAEDEIRSLRDELRELTIFIGGINDHQSDGTTALVQDLINQLRRVSWQAEDVVDQYLLDVARQEEKKFLKKVFTGMCTLSKKGKLAAEAKNIKLTIRTILEKKESYGVRLDYGAPSDRPVQQNGENEVDSRRRNVEEEDVVGFDRQFHEVMEMLMLRSGEKAQELRVVSIIGMGGLGKTTLARKIFNSKKIEMRFWIRVWVVVSEHVKGKHVLKNILQCLDEKVENVDDDDYLKKMLKQRLDEMSYLIVLDDLWTPKQWEELKSYFPIDQKRGSRILLTSRVENVANVASTDSTTYHLNPLGDADSWNLFCKKALKGEECPSNLQTIGKGIVSKCKGLPLAIIVLASSLSAAEAKPSFRYWSKTLSDTSWHPNADNDCSKILFLSYLNLPPHLKTCFLYVGVFPENFEIATRELYLLWVVEEFVNPRQSGELDEDVAEQYLSDLADRNLIMISKRKSDGRIKSCRIHDLLRELCMKEAERCNLYKIGAIGAHQNGKEGIRRLTWHKLNLTPHVPHPLYKGLTTFLDFANKGSSNLTPPCEDVSVMRVLRFYVEELYHTLPIRTKNMILLRYLKVIQTGSENFQKSIMIPYLSDLQVLDIWTPGVVDLPNGIWKMKLLRHVYVRGWATMPDAPSSHDSLPYLQTLSCIIYEEHTPNMLSAVRFPELRKLFVSALPGGKENLESLPIHLFSNLLHLVALKISCKHSVRSPSTSLNGDAFPSTLFKIHLSNIVLTSDQWRLLGELNNLQVLKLSTGVTSTDEENRRFLNQPLVFHAEAFPQLLHLKLMTSTHPALFLFHGALRTLEYLIVGSRKDFLRLSALPDQLWRSTALKNVKVVNPSDRMRMHIQGLDNYKRSKVTIIG